MTCSNNRLQNINLSNITGLRELVIDGNNLPSVDVSNNLSLMDMSCTNNLLTHLDLSNNILLRSLNCARNNLTDLDLTNNHLFVAGGFSGNPFIRNDSALIAFAVSLPDWTGQDTGTIELVRADVPELVCNIIQSKNYIIH